MWTTALLLAGVLTGLASTPVLRALSAPADTSADTTDTTAAGVPAYAALAGHRFSLAVAGCSLAALAAIWLRLEAVQAIVWLPLATVGVLLVAIDARTTWLPLALTQVLWLTTLSSAVVQVGLTPASERGALAGRLLLGALVVGGFFFAFWWLAGGLGFGDVRLAPVLGAVTASVSWQLLVAALLLGTILGAAHGIVCRLCHRDGGFPYGPALVAGAFLGLVLAG
ncbi:MAG: prepilin peptidase [Propionibacteriaceae bacterium]|nr:prepilin peptidase [Propionibacteriaceae bacterium]